MIARTSGVLFGFAVFVACTGGGGPIGDASSTSSGGASSSGSTSSGGSSSGASSSGGTTTCTEVIIGGTIDPAIGGSTGSQVIAQGVLDFAGAASSRVGDLTTACKNIAVALDAPPGEQTSADGQTDPRSKLDAWCKLAVARIGAVKADAGGTISVTFSPPVCKLSVPEKATCQGRCAGTGPCDTTAYPMKCSGGTLTNGTCEGGKLEGGCQVEAKCDAACDATVAAKASCPSPSVAVTASGASNATAAADLEAALEADLPQVLALKEHCETEADIAASFSGTVSSVSDIKPACIPPLVAATSNAVKDVQTCLSSAAAVAGTIN